MKRPKIITIICIIGYVGVLFTFPQVFSPQIKKLGLLAPAVYGIVISAQFIACVGLWYFKRWGAELYLLAFFARVLFHLLTETAGPMLAVSALLNLAFVFVLLKHYGRMGSSL